MFRSISKALIVRKISLTLIKTLLNVKQREYEERLLSLLNDYLIKKILLITLRKKNSAI